MNTIMTKLLMFIVLISAGSLGLGFLWHAAIYNSVGSVCKGEQHGPRPEFSIWCTSEP